MVPNSPQQTLPPENEMANCEMADSLDVEMCEKKQVNSKDCFEMNVSF